MPTCEFCQEFQHPAVARFGLLYPDIPTRIIRRSANFVAIPTLGQIFRGSLLVLPISHFETCADLGPALKSEFITFSKEMSIAVEQFGYPVFFEHGAYCQTGGGCGIYHAHLHIVPLPAAILPSVFFSENLGVAYDLNEALSRVGRSDQYLLFGNENEVAYAHVKKMQTKPNSQHFRRLLTEQFGRDCDWDWRAATAPEFDLLATLEAFGGPSAAY